MNLTNRSSNRVGESNPLNNWNTGIPHFQTVQRGFDINETVDTNKKKGGSESNEKLTSVSSSAALPSSWSIFGACQFPTAFRGNKEFAASNYRENRILINSSRNEIVTPLRNEKKDSATDATSVLSLLKNPGSSSDIEFIRRQYQQRTRTICYQSESTNLQTSASVDDRTPISKVNKNKTALTSSTSDYFSTPIKRKLNTFVTPKSSAYVSKSSSTGTSVDSSSNNVVVALTEGRGNARGEVGIAAMDLKRPFLILCQISDTQTYASTLRKINILNPIEIIIPNTFFENMNTNQLYQVLVEHFPRLRITTVQRKQFNDTNGYNQIQGLCLEEYSSVISLAQRKYYSLAAANALLKYAEFQQNIIFAPKSLRIDYQGGDNIMFIDLSTAEKLELIVGQNRSCAVSASSNTLFRVLNKCSTLGGQKRLRTLILQPFVDQSEIEAKLNCVEELCENTEFLSTIKALLSKFWDVEQLLGLCGQISNLKDNYSAAELLINQALLLKGSLEAIPSLKSALSAGKSKFFSSFQKILENEHYEIMLTKISKIISEDAHLSQKYEVNLFQRCFSIKTGVNSFLDIARVAYSELGQDFKEIVNDLIGEYHLSLTIKTLKSKGPVLHLKINNTFKVSSLPSVFVQVQKSRSSITMTTKELLFLKERMNHFIQEIQLLSSTIIFDMLQEIREHMGALYRLCEKVAELDLLVSFALISRHFTFVRPVFSNNRMEVKSSIHPILNHISQSKPVANDIVSSTNENMCVITGPNMGGKSVYIRQIALLQIMSQIGCYVPAESAVFRLTDRIFSRIGFHDDIENNSSTFIVEIKDMQYILKSLTPRSLIIIDELCRGSSTEEGTALAWAISEELLASTAFIFLTTHFMFLTKLQNLYPNVSNYHLEALEVNSNTSSCHLIYTHRMVPGVLKLDHYGLKLARSTAIPESVLKVSEELAKKLTISWKGGGIASENVSPEKQIDQVVVKLLNILDNGMLTLDVIRDMVQYVKETNLLKVLSNENNMREKQFIEKSVVGYVRDPYEYVNSGIIDSTRSCSTARQTLRIIEYNQGDVISEDAKEPVCESEEGDENDAEKWMFEDVDPNVLNTPSNGDNFNWCDKADVYYSDLIIGDKGGLIPVKFDNNFRGYFSH